MSPAAFFALLVSLIGVLIGRKRRPYSGVGRCAFANLFLSLALLLFALRPVLPDSIRIFSANALLVAASVLSLEGTRELCGLRPRVRAMYAGGALVLLTVAYFDYFKSSVNARITAMSLFIGAGALLCSVTLLRRAPARRPLGVLVTSGMFVLCAAVLIAGAVYFFFAPPLSCLFAPSLPNAIFFVSAGLSIAGCSIGWSVLADERLAMDLDNAQRRAIAADTARREYLAMVDHEIRNPVGGVVAATELLLDTDLTAEQQECAYALLKEGETLVALSGGLLDLCRIEAGELAIDSSAFDLCIVIRRVAETYAPIATRKQVELRVEYTAGVPRRFIGDASRIRQVIAALVEKAVRYTPAGQIRVVAACQTKNTSKAGMLVLVTYTGVGISQEEIGFVVAKKLAGILGGSLHVESQAGESSTLAFTLPLSIET